MRPADTTDQTSSAPPRQPAVFAPLPEHLAMDAGRLPVVCIVTGELVGPFKNGGLGTSMTGLAELLGAMGAQVTVLYTGDVAPSDLPVWKQRYARTGIRLEALSESEKIHQVGPIAAVDWTKALLLYETLRRRRFDVVHFNDTLGEGVYCLVAKRMGMAFPDTLLSLALHSPTEWILEANGNEANWLGFTCFQTAERIWIRAADLLWGPSRYLLGWIGARGYELASQHYNQQYVIPTGSLFEGGRQKCAVAALPQPPAPLRKPKEIVFFGRLEERKGIRLFAAAITRLGETLRERGVSILLMGKESSVNGVPTAEFLKARSGAWPFEWRIESGFDQRQAVAYLRENNCVTVMASPVDNSPCTVYEALQFGIPFIASATGGIPELIHPDDHGKHLFDYRVEALCARIMDVIDNGIGVARPAVSVAENQARWLAMHVGWRGLLPVPVAPPQPRRYGVVIDHTADAEAIERTHAAVKRELGAQAVALAVLRRDILPLGTVAEAPGVVLVDELVDTGPADVFAAFKAAGADALFLIRSGIDLAPAAAALLDRGLGAGADGVVPFAKIGTQAVMPVLAGSAAQSLLEGAFDPGGALFDLAAVERCLGAGLDCLDRNRLYFGLLEEMQAVDARLWPLPEPVFHLQDGADAVVKLPGAAIRNRTYARAPARERNQMIATANLAYRHVFPVRAPVADPNPVQVLAAQAATLVRQSAGLQSAGRRVITAVAGERGVEIVKRIVRRLVPQ